jgi:hypothetical protein
MTDDGLDISKDQYRREQAKCGRSLEMSAERSEAKLTAMLAKRSRTAGRATRRFEAELR